MTNQKQNLISHEIISSLLLLSSAILALIINNSPLYTIYDQFLYSILSIELNGIGLSKPLLLWINDGLMAIFFLLVGLELKREIVEGELSDVTKVILPIIGSVGGMLAPILIYCVINLNSETNIAGWGIPMATDIAFALGVLALFGKRVPTQLKLFLLTLAIIDDLGAILVIGLFHTHKISWQSLGYAQAATICLIIFNILNVQRTSLYLAVGFLLWLVTLQSGFHATIAGVVLALTIPVRSKSGEPVLKPLEENIKPLVSFLILPVFSFANSGIPFDDISLSAISHPVVLGISLGLIVGNTIGISTLTILTQKLLKVKTTYTNSQLIGVSLICGIGFTMSLFIAALSFNDTNLQNLSRFGIMIGSLLSMILGSIVLHYTLPKLENNN